MKTNVYIDGFSLFYGCLKGTQCKWLNPEALCQAVFPHHQINRIRYFTARVRATPSDPQKPDRQDIYIRALRTIPNLTIHEGHFLSHIARMPLAKPPRRGSRMVEVIKTEEKGSDVNLATYLLLDGFNAEYDVAIIISNDGDLEEPINIVQARLGFPVGVLNPHLDKKKTSWALKNAATFYRRIRGPVLNACQFPATLQDTKGTFTKPKEW
ncbi:MAG: hypothetical protein A2V52_07910 [Actinobacteria bacterium RBG_19FT_COMBO_54_7]|uniref:NYN domain-containing protein n=1 Tax=Candidatus Solincola sediminis TaxID=1797199 RepID=A0A1F2WRS6_9ACTN|nr:MAG: hypothetical protein A2Y75_01190 [Candidatus Solincola sediminis]OFW60964.1 MAG: hypothetical protein A2W01_12395 [Candidatus Solincola sediminis]OFW67472.1 MAG: hypothetical protein A2V52_07910 [Actinobacteria bacterium RBG_19FT_COMBO_54_7]